MKRIHGDIDMNSRKRQSTERALSESTQKLLGLEHQRDFKVGLEMQLEELREQKNTSKDDYEVRLIDLLSALVFISLFAL
jgi:hypothetical protein